MTIFHSERNYKMLFFAYDGFRFYGFLSTQIKPPPIGGFSAGNQPPIQWLFGGPNYLETRSREATGFEEKAKKLRENRVQEMTFANKWRSAWGRKLVQNRRHWLKKVGPQYWWELTKFIDRHMDKHNWRPTYWRNLKVGIPIVEFSRILTFRIWFQGTDGVAGGFGSDLEVEEVRPQPLVASNFGA